MRRSSYGMLAVATVLVLAFLACAAPSAPVTAPRPASGPTPQGATERPTTTASPTSREQQLIEGAKKEGEVIFWTYYFPAWTAINLMQRFQQKYPFLKVIPWDTPLGATAIAKQVEEVKAGRYTVDVLLYQQLDILEAIQLGLVEKYDFPGTEAWIGQPKPPQSDYYRNIARDGYAPVYNTKLINSAEAPKSWKDLNDAKWRGKSLISTSGTDFMMGFSYVLGEGKTIEWDKAFAFWREVVAKTRPAVAGGYSGPRTRVVSGEFALFLAAPLGGTLLEMWRGAPLAIPPVYTYTRGNSLALAKNAPHPNAARLWIDFLSTEGLVQYADVAGLQSSHPELNKKTRAYQTLAASGLTFIDPPPPIEVFSLDNLRKSEKLWATDLHKP